MTEARAARRRRIRGGAWWLPIVLSIAFVVLQPLLSSGWAMFPDSYRYAKQAERVLGASASQAHLRALDAFCTTRADYRWDDGWIAQPGGAAQREERRDACIDRYADRGDVTTLDPRYQAIFTTRPGYPLLAAPFVAGWGIAAGMRVLGLIVAVAGGLVCFGALRLSGMRPVAAAAGQVIYLVSPLGFWAVQALGEGLVSVCAVGALAGVLWMRRGAHRLGAVTLAASWLALAFVRFSSLLLIAAALAVACGVIAVTVGRAWRRSALAAGAICAAAAVATAVAIPVFGLPGSSVTLQDTFTDHFAEPFVPHPWLDLLDTNRTFWPAWLGEVSVSVPVLVCAAAGIALLLWADRALMWLALALFAAGLAQIAAHPLPQEATRLGVLMWMPAVLGLPAAVGWVRGRLPARR